jgi:UTP:GlnB (protein PII) uridylyltransferase
VWRKRTTLWISGGWPIGRGLLSALCRWFAMQGADIESLQARTVGGVADDTFLVVGHLDADTLAALLQP